MSDSPKHDNVYSALAAAQGEFAPVPKNRIAKVKGKNRQTGVEFDFTYKYADLADCLKMALPILSKHGLALTQPLRRKEGKLYLVSELHFGAELISSDGLELLQTHAAQEFAGELTYWRRYDACALLGIAAEEDIDGRGPTPAKAAPVEDETTRQVREQCDKMLEARGMNQANRQAQLARYSRNYNALLAKLKAEESKPTQEEPPVIHKPPVENKPVPAKPAVEAKPLTPADGSGKFKF